MFTTELQLLCGDNLDELPQLDADSVDSCVTDPPYGLEFMGKGWDHGVPGVEYWQHVLRVLKPGAYMLAFSSPRTQHRLTCAVEDAGFEIRDCLLWLYGTGFPKGQGCLKPAYEPVILARKPGKKVLPLGIDACRIPAVSGDYAHPGNAELSDTNGIDYGWAKSGGRMKQSAPHELGRYPANVLHDGSDEALEAFGEAARFFYCAKASRSERGDGNTHPTVKPLALMRWLVKLVTPPGGTVLDPFAGSGSTLVAAIMEGRGCIGIEKEEAYFDIAAARVEAATSGAEGRVSL